MEFNSLVLPNKTMRKVVEVAMGENEKGLNGLRGDPKCNTVGIMRPGRLYATQSMSTIFPVQGLVFIWSDPGG